MQVSCANVFPNEIHCLPLQGGIQAHVNVKLYLRVHILTADEPLPSEEFLYLHLSQREISYHAY